MKQIQEMVPFEIETPSDDELRRRFEDEHVQFKSKLSGGNKGQPNAVKRKERRKAQKLARAKCRA